MTYNPELPRRRFARGATYVFKEINASMHDVVLDGLRIERPPHVSSEEWQDFWAEVSYLNDG